MLMSTVCALISAGGLGVAFLVARRRRYAAAMRVAAVSLLPLGLAMTGVVRFVVNMTMNPVAWAGFGVLGLALLLFLCARLAAGRGRRGGPPALPDARRRAGREDPADDFSDIEAILRKHGI